MPYIKEEDRERIRPHIGELAQNISNAGELNYAMTILMHECINNWGLRYATLNEIIGAIECMKLELYARVVRPYEKIKIEENGDVCPDC